GGRGGLHRERAQRVGATGSAADGAVGVTVGDAIVVDGARIDTKAGSYRSCFCCGGVQSFASCLCRGRDAEISAGAMAASVPSAGMGLYQTDFAFFPV